MVVQQQHTLEVFKSESFQSPSDRGTQASSCINKCENPWPYIAKYFKFKARQGDNVSFECVQCLPIHKVISTSLKSRNNLKKHLQRKHSLFSLKEFETLISESRKVTKSNKQQEEQFAGINKRQMVVQQQHTLEIFKSESFQSPSESGTQASSSSGGDKLANSFINECENPWPYLTKYFKFKARQGANVSFECVQCLPIHKVISTSLKSRNNLKKHLQRKHSFFSLKEFETHISESRKVSKINKQEQNELNKMQMFMQQPTLLDATPSQSRGKVNEATIEDRVINVFVENILPFHIVESDSFKFLLELVPGSQNISSRSLARDIEARFEGEKERLKSTLQDLSSVATSVDLWAHKNRSYLGVTAHWIERTSLKRMKAVLACQRLKGPHTYDAIAKAIHGIHSAFALANKVTRITTDNGYNFPRALQAFVKQEPRGAEDDDCDDVTNIVDVANILGEEERGYDFPKHSRCAANTLCLVATADADVALDMNVGYKRANESAFAKAKDLWNRQHCVESSGMIKSEFGRFLVVPTLTQWSSIYDGVVRLVDIFGSKDKRRDLEEICNVFEIPFFTVGDMAFLRDYRQVMEPVAKAACILRAEERAYLGVLLPTLAICLKTLKQLKETRDVGLCEPLLEALHDGFMKRFGHLFEDTEYLLSTALNPQFKFALWPEWLPRDKFNAEHIKNRISNHLVNLIEKSRSGEEEKVDDYFKALYDSGVERMETEKLVKEFMEEEPHKLLESRLFPCQALLDLFIKYNTPVPSSAAVERLFCLGNVVLEPKRTELSDAHFEMLVFLKGNRNI